MARAYGPANGLWVGEQPMCLQNLTLTEQLLLARVYPRVFVVKLRPKKRGVGPDKWQYGLRGTVTSFEMNTAKVAEMADGSMRRGMQSVCRYAVSLPVL
ncbi:hypothetical protein PENSPDRAFT_648982 [Peniophora sp. CONT]|nr:hypothetical protein PENSPDRAFT_648982 [Peniophora sp. CONT]